MFIYAIQIPGSARIVHRHDGSCLARKHLLHILKINGAGLRHYFARYWDFTRDADRPKRGEIGERLHEDPVSRPNTLAHDGKMERGSPGIYAYHLPPPEIILKTLFEDMDEPAHAEVGFVNYLGQCLFLQVSDN